MTDHCAVSPKAERHDQFAVHAVFISAALPKAAEPLRIMQMCPDTGSWPLLILVANYPE
jgi:hypothetical protein